MKIFSQLEVFMIIVFKVSQMPMYYLFILDFLLLPTSLLHYREMMSANFTVNLHTKIHYVWQWPFYVLCGVVPKVLRTMNNFQNIMVH
jgi:hypothetical protein